MNSVPTLRRMEEHDVKAILEILTVQLKARGYQPDSLLQVAGILFLTHGTALVDHNKGRDGVVQHAADTYRAVVGNVIQSLIDYRYRMLEGQQS